MGMVVASKNNNTATPDQWMPFMVNRFRQTGHHKWVLPIEWLALLLFFVPTTIIPIVARCFDLLLFIVVLIIYYGVPCMIFLLDRQEWKQQEQ